MLCFLNISQNYFFCCDNDKKPLAKKTNMMFRNNRQKLDRRDKDASALSSFLVVKIMYQRKIECDLPAVINSLIICISF
ncbi:hypothetical protein TSAR_015670 [Trichomalopsis sarcophagae]|uniref:Uncharacterized protein n=1 Tax=Trichomalopsis sarcophagae TaxID=543379 RepID=A0A232F1W8_9HYME|nr:hypothetical protein TSAR_015670 [Trichomalopsis sarcophagae]